MLISYDDNKCDVSRRDAWDNVTFRLKLSEKMVFTVNVRFPICRKWDTLENLFLSAHDSHLYEMGARERDITILSHSIILRKLINQLREKLTVAHTV